jgi:hypothetical protein
MEIMTHASLCSGIGGLHELKIDYRGLIESSLAIDANTLETNPYK